MLSYFWMEMLSGDWNLQPHAGVWPVSKGSIVGTIIQWWTLMNTDEHEETDDAPLLVSTVNPPPRFSILFWPHKIKIDSSLYMRPQKSVGIQF